MQLFIASRASETLTESGPQMVNLDHVQFHQFKNPSSKQETISEVHGGLFIIYEGLIMSHIERSFCLGGQMTELHVVYIVMACPSYSSLIT